MYFLSRSRLSCGKGTCIHRKKGTCIHRKKSKHRENVCMNGGGGGGGW